MAVAHAASVAPIGQDPVEALSRGLLGVAGLCLDEQARHIASPRSVLSCRAPAHFIIPTSLTYI